MSDDPREVAGEILALNAKKNRTALDELRLAELCERFGDHAESGSALYRALRLVHY